MWQLQVRLQLWLGSDPCPGNSICCRARKKEREKGREEGKKGGREGGREEEGRRKKSKKEELISSPRGQKQQDVHTYVERRVRAGARVSSAESL